ncbi:T9SS type A sorting domain-containing protein [Winogradskyella vidalii]|uniref:T9SS type A sorting domain-containing protein n=1 Tax=Winogradskyella vidalii TaxID=2615024 RepID=UPI0015CA8C73|nr:T9SS type A sorting domain-containing protein [Winogradskyella vidalii]
MKNFYAFLVSLLIGYSGFGFTTETPNTAPYDGTEDYLVSNENSANNTFSDQITYCDITISNGTITEGSAFNVSAEVYIAGATDISPTEVPLLEAEIGYIKINDINVGDFNEWTWVTATFNPLATGNNDEYTADIGTDIGLNPGNYYYVSRFRVDALPYFYGGVGGIWDGTTNESGELEVNLDTSTTSIPTTVATLTIEGCGDVDTHTVSDYDASEDPIIWVEVIYDGLCSRLIVDTEGSSPSGFDTEIGIYDAYGNLLQYDDDGGTGSLGAIDREDWLSGLAAGTYYVAAGARDMIWENPVNETHFGVTSANTTATGSLKINASTPILVDYCNIESPDNGNIYQGATFNVSSEISQTNITDTAGPNSDIGAWIGYSTTIPTTTSDFADAALWTWKEATYQSYTATGVGTYTYETEIGTTIETPGTYYYVSRFSVEGGDFAYGGITTDGSDGNFWDGSTYKAGVLTVNPKQEPTNHVIDFTATVVSDSEIDLTWNVNHGAQPADGFLIVGKKNLNTFYSPVDGTVGDPLNFASWNFPNARIYLTASASGIQTYNVTGLTSGTEYNFKIYPYTNAPGSFIDYKTDITIPEASATTLTTIYTFNGTWSPSDPNGLSTISDAIEVTSGDATITVSTSINTVTVSPGAGLIINSGAILTVDGGVTLESASNSYSSLIYNGDGATITGGDIKYKRYVNSNTNGNDLISAPLAGETWSDFLSSDTNIGDLLDNGATSPTTYAFAPFDKATGEYVNYTDADNPTLTSGTGYRAATDSGTTLTFTGTMPAETVDVTVSYEDLTTPHRDWNLIGNPYPSYISISDFLNGESGTIGFSNMELLDSGSGIYGYDGDSSNGWDMITLANLEGTDRLMAPGQGFLIAIEESLTKVLTFPPLTINALPPYDIRFNNSMTTTGNSDDFIPGRNANSLTFFKLSANTATKNYSTQFYFNEQSSEDLDHGYDGKILGDAAPSFALYSELVEDENGFGLPLALQSLSITDMMDVVIPLGVNANAGEQLTFSITEMELPSSVEVYLDDNLTNTTTLISASDYVITPSNNLSGTGRFYLRVSENSTLSVGDEDFNSIKIHTQQSPKTVIIQGIINEGATAKIYDIQGRLVSNTTLESRNLINEIDASDLQDGVYVVTLTDGSQQKTQKVILR